MARKPKILILIAGAILAAAVLGFPRVLAFADLAARELRYLWWLVLLISLGMWMAFVVGRGRE